MLYFKNLNGCISDEGIKLGDFVTLPCSDDRVSSQPQAGHHRGQQGDYRPIGNRGSQGNYRSQGYSIDPELNGTISSIYSLLYHFERYFLSPLETFFSTVFVALFFKIKCC